ncbi:alpha/beta hydrolase fold domain-containing protein [Arcticibacter sp.]|jgi:acetyl esterase/lipase|uniref:alpha/beta hydrolase fold domain-containing protein n=1 Tax=Arcticibacter sp. TaxID=1872630 RepID=UPI00388EDF9B
MIRLGLSIASLLLSLLSVFGAPTYHTWLLAVMVSEFPLIFMGIALVLVLMSSVTDRFKTAGTVISVLALILFSSPVARALLIADNLQIELNQAFKGSEITPSGKPAFSFWKLATRGKSSARFDTFRYADDEGTTSTLDFYRADSSGIRPCIVVVHGGSWSSGDSRQLPEINTHLANLGYHVASVNYHKAPEWQSPQPLEDVRKALSYLRTRAGQLMIDTSRLVILGRSAGAQIALMAAYQGTEPGLKGVISFYGPADMIWGYSKPASRWVMDSRRVMENYLGGTYQQIPDKYRSASPIEHVSETSPPTLLIHGRNDVLVAYEHSTRLAAKLTRNGVPHYLLTLPWATHGFDYTLSGPGGQLSTFTVATFLRKILK